MVLSLKPAQQIGCYLHWSIYDEASYYREEQTVAPNGIYSGQRMECEEHSLWLSTRLNDCIILS